MLSTDLWSLQILLPLKILISSVLLFSPSFMILSSTIDLLPHASHENVCVFLCLWNEFVILSLLNAQKYLKAVPLWPIARSPFGPMHSCYADDSPVRDFVHAVLKFTVKLFCVFVCSFCGGIYSNYCQILVQWF